MLNRAHRALREHRVTVYTAALLCLLFFHMLWYVNFFLAESLAGVVSAPGVSPDVLEQAVFKLVNE